MASPVVATPKVDGRRLLHSRVLQTIALILGVAGATAAAYFGILGWDKRTTSGVDAYLNSPYHGWQVATAVGVLAVLALGTGWLGHPIIGSLTLAASLTSCWACDAALNVRDDRNWPIGMTLVAWASLGFALLLSASVAEARQMVRRRAEAAQQALLAAERARQAAELAEVRRREAEAAARRERDAEAYRVAAAARVEAARREAQLNTARKAKVVKVFSARVRSRRSAS